MYTYSGIPSAPAVSGGNPNPKPLHLQAKMVKLAQVPAGNYYRQPPQQVGPLLLTNLP